MTVFNLLLNVQYFILKEWAWLRRDGWTMIEEFDGEGGMGWTYSTPYFVQIWQNSFTGEIKEVTV